MVRVSGYIQTVNKQLISRVAVFEHLSLLAFNREETGIYHIWIYPGSHMVTFLHPSYTPQNINITTYHNNTMIMNVTLLEVKSYSFDSSVDITILDTVSQAMVFIPLGSLI